MGGGGGSVGGGAPVAIAALVGIRVGINGVEVAGMEVASGCEPHATKNSEAAVREIPNSVALRKNSRLVCIGFKPCQHSGSESSFLLREPVNLVLTLSVNSLILWDIINYYFYFLQVDINLYRQLGNSQTENWASLDLNCALFLVLVHNHIPSYPYFAAI